MITFEDFNKSQIFLTMRLDTNLKKEDIERDFQSKSQMVQVSDRHGIYAIRYMYARYSSD
ncbi:MAG: hypothetical protein RM338_01940 [Nostoc sp. DedQUE12a]|nr:hypothetical protein [Nostoc sp. DedQUE12a]